MAVDYPYIRKYGRMMGSFDYYIDDQMADARAENAPENATYRQHDGTWSTTDDIISDETRKRLGLDPLPASALPSRYTVTIELDFQHSGPAATATVTRAGRQIYRDRFDTYQDAAARALLEIRASERG